MALTLGLTGGIGAGKSLAAEHLARLGAIVVDADVLAREVLSPDGPGLPMVVEEFGPQVLRADGTLDRARLGARVFDDATARARLNAITHPLVRERTRAIVARAPDDAIVVNDVPLLVESGLAPTFHLVAVVFAEGLRRLARLVENRGMSLRDAHARMAAQAGDVERRAVADIVWHNDSSPAALRDQIARVWHERLVPYRDNVRSGHGAALPDEPVPYDPRWPAEADRVLARLRRVLGEAMPVEHVGPTAIPGTAAPDLLCFESVTLVANLWGVGDRLAEAGWFLASEPIDSVLADAGAVRFVSADPGRPAILRCVASDV